MLFVIGSSSELLGLCSSPELWFCVLFRSFGVVLVNFPVGRFTRTVSDVSSVHVSSVSVDNPTPSCAPVHVLPLFCGRCVVPICSRPRFAPVLWTVCGSDVLPSTFCPCFVDRVWFRYAPVHENAPFCGRDAEGGLVIPSSAPRPGWCGRRGGSARGRPAGRSRMKWRWRGTRTSPSRGWSPGRTRSAPAPAIS